MGRDSDMPVSIYLRANTPSDIRATTRCLESFAAAAADNDGVFSSPSTESEVARRAAPFPQPKRRRRRARGACPARSCLPRCSKKAAGRPNGGGGGGGGGGGTCSGRCDKRLLMAACPARSSNEHLTRRRRRRRPSKQTRVVLNSVDRVVAVVVSRIISPVSFAFCTFCFRPIGRGLEEY